jgi:outer membrane protein TolC
VDSTRISDARFRIEPTFSRHGLATQGSERSPWRQLLSVIALVLGLATSLPAQSAAPRVALVLDQDAPSLEPQVAAFKREIQGFFRPGEITLLAPRAGDGTAAGVSRALDRALSDSSVAAVVALGPIGSHQLAHAGEPKKPAIAATIVDAGWQGIPKKDGASGVHNLAYTDESYALSGTVADFHRMIPFHRLAVLLDPELLAVIPELAGNVRYLVRGADAGAVVIPARGTADQILAALPADADAVYLTPIPALGEAETARLIAGLSARRLPTLSHNADAVPAGAFASYEPPEHWLRRARRVAVDLQRILAGEDAGTLPVRLVGAPRLTLNLATARTIGFSPGYSVRTDAELVGTDSLGPADTVSLAEAMRGAVDANLDLKAADLEVESGVQDVRLARSNLLPEVETRFGGTVTREGTAAASLGQQPQRQLDGGLSFSVPLYSEQAWAGYGSERRLQEGREAGREQTRLDVVLDAAQAYISVLQARTLADVRRSNLYRNRTNLETARVREDVGSTSRADVYRWQGEVANSRRDLIAAESQVQVATLALKRVLNRPLDRPMAERPVTLGDPALLAQDSTVLGWFGDPARYAVLTRFLVGEALRVSPELAQADAAIAAQARQRTAAGRALWMPTLSLEGGLDNVFSRDGAGSTAPTLPGGTTLGAGPDLQWQFRIQASLPLFTGFRRDAARAQSGFDLERRKVERAGAAQTVEQRVRSALETAASSYAAIALTREASDAANRNYELVSDAYARGTASITVLIDAQDAAESSAEAAANAVHDFLLDLMRVERAMGNFGALRPAEQQQAFLERLHTLEEQR